MDKINEKVLYIKSTTHQMRREEIVVLSFALRTTWKIDSWKISDLIFKIQNPPEPDACLTCPVSRNDLPSEI
jgi:hypothetical protein